PRLVADVRAGKGLPGIGVVFRVLPARHVRLPMWLAGHVQHRADAVVLVNRLDQNNAYIFSPRPTQLVVHKIAFRVALRFIQSTSLETQIKVGGRPCRIDRRWRVSQLQLLTLQCWTTDHAHQFAVVDRIFGHPISERSVDPWRWTLPRFARRNWNHDLNVMNVT